MKVLFHDNDSSCSDNVQVLDISELRDWIKKNKIKYDCLFHCISADDESILHIINPNPIYLFKKNIFQTNIDDEYFSYLMYKHDNLHLIFKGIITYIKKNPTKSTKQSYIDILEIPLSILYTVRNKPIISNCDYSIIGNWEYDFFIQQYHEDEHNTDSKDLIIIPFNEDYFKLYTDYIKMHLEPTNTAGLKEFIEQSETTNTA